MGDMYNNIERLCQLKGIKVGRLCADLEISRGVMSNLKNGSTKELSSPTVKKIANYFGVATDVIYGTLTKNGPADNDEANELMREMYERPELRALFKTTKGVKPEDIKYVDDMLKRFKEGYRDD